MVIVKIIILITSSLPVINFISITFKKAVNKFGGRWGFEIITLTNRQLTHVNIIFFFKIITLLETIF